MTTQDSGYVVDHAVPHHVGQETIIRLENVQKWYGDFQVLRNIDLTVRKGERIVICGPSGSGKSTLIRCINRLEQYQEGRVFVDGIDLTADRKGVDAVRAEVGMVFQQFNLFLTSRWSRTACWRR